MWSVKNSLSHLHEKEIKVREALEREWSEVLWSNDLHKNSLKKVKKSPMVSRKKNFILRFRLHCSHVHSKAAT